MQQSIFEITENRALNQAKNVFRMRLAGDVSPIAAPGQFVNVGLEGLYLRRPISVCDVEGDTLTLIYKTVGRGTEQMARLKAGETLDLLTGLGNGYDLTCSGEYPLLLGGGVGVPPLYGLAKRLIAQGRHVRAVLGFNTRDEIFYEQEFKALGACTAVTTVDGSAERKGFVTDALPEKYSFVYACGPLPMLKAVFRTISTGAQFSLEERMGCGFGACMGCSIQTANGPKRVCKDGPVFRREELLWDD